MRLTPRTALVAGALALCGSLLTASPARAQFPIFYGGQVLNPDGRKIGTPPGRAPRPSDYPNGTIGYSIQKSRPGYYGYRSSNPSRGYYAPQQRAYRSQAGTYYYPQQQMSGRRYPR